LILRIIIQSTKDPYFLDSRIESFLTGFRDTVLSLTSEQLAENVSAVRMQLIEKPKNQYEEFSDFYSEIESKTYLFRRRALLADSLASIDVTVPILLAFFDRYISATSDQRIKVSSQFYGQGTVYKKLKGSTVAVNGKDTRKVVLISEPSLFKEMSPLLAAPNHEPHATAAAVV